MSAESALLFGSGKGESGFTHFQVGSSSPLSSFAELLNVFAESRGLTKGI